jgi:hypothetical protein
MIIDNDDQLISYGEGTAITFAQHQTAGRPLKSPEKTPDPSNVKSARDVANG